MADGRDGEQRVCRRMCQRSRAAATCSPGRGPGVVPDEQVFAFAEVVGASVWNGQPGCANLLRRLRGTKNLVNFCG